MASMRESDTGLWLHNKLGSADELWAPPSIASLLTASVIDNIRLCFHGLSSPVKLKLLLGILHLPRRAVDEKEILLSGRYRQGADVSPRDLSETLEGCDPSGCLAEEPEICGPRRLAQCWESQGLGGGESGSWQDVHFRDGEAASESQTKETRCIPPAAQKTSVPPH